MKPYDPNKPLDDDTRQRLLERNRWQEVEENDRLFASDSQEDEDPDFPEDESEEDSNEDQGELEPIDDPEDPQNLLKPELKAELDHRGIEYPRRALKSQLVELLRQSEESSSE